MNNNVHQPQQDVNQNEGIMMNNRQRAPCEEKLEGRRGIPPIKPAKMNIPEFGGIDVDSWLQTIEIYFDAARTPLEQRTEVAVTYLTGEAMQWWRDTNDNATNLP
jgi:hypothetical protein